MLLLFGLQSLICALLKNKEVIKEAVVVKEVTDHITKTADLKSGKVALKFGSTKCSWPAVVFGCYHL